MRAQHVTLRAVGRRGMSLRAILSDAPTFTAGVGGWESVTRPGRRPLTVWRGAPETTMTLPLIFDGWANGRSQERAILTLERLGGLAGRRDGEPPLLIVRGWPPMAAQRVGSAARWVITGMEWGDAIRRVSDGHRLRQQVTVTLTLHVEDDRLERLRSSSRPSYRFIRARRGDTYEKIAARELGRARYGARLARLNGRRSPDVRLRAGARVKLPTGYVLREWAEVERLERLARRVR